VSRPSPFRPVLVSLVAAGLVATAGCSENSARPVSDAPTAVTSELTSSPSPDDWVERSDPGSGLRFRLPHDDPARTGRRPGQAGTEVTSTRYAATEGDVRLSVNVLTTPERPGAVRRTVRAQYLPFLVVDTVRNQGATDAGVVLNSRLRGVPYRAFDSQLTFVRQGRRAVWFTRAIELPRATVVAQAVAYVDLDEDAVDRVRATFRRLTDGLVVPA
jgi:hypothetical protein